MLLTTGETNSRPTYFKQGEPCYLLEFQACFLQVFVKYRGSVKGEDGGGGAWREVISDRLKMDFCGSGVWALECWWCSRDCDLGNHLSVSFLPSKPQPESVLLFSIHKYPNAEHCNTYSLHIAHICHQLVIAAQYNQYDTHNLEELLYPEKKYAFQFRKYSLLDDNAEILIETFSWRPGRHDEPAIYRVCIYLNV